MPKIADELERLNANLEALLAELRKQAGLTKETSAPPQSLDAK